MLIKASLHTLAFRNLHQWVLPNTLHHTLTLQCLPTSSSLRLEVQRAAIPTRCNNIPQHHFNTYLFLIYNTITSFNRREGMLNLRNTSYDEAFRPIIGYPLGSLGRNAFNKRWKQKDKKTVRGGIRKGQLPLVNMQRQKNRYVYIRIILRSSLKNFIHNVTCLA